VLIKKEAVKKLPDWKSIKPINDYFGLSFENILLKTKQKKLKNEKEDNLKWVLN